MIALGLTVELLAAVLLVVGLLMGAAGIGLLWASVALVLVGLLITMIGVRRARPTRGAWIPVAVRRPADRDLG